MCDCCLTTCQETAFLDTGKVPCCLPATNSMQNWCVIKADTLGVVYSAFSARPTWLGGKGNAKVDPFTKNVLIQDAQNQLVQTGMCAAQAASIARSDTEKTLKQNHACPDNCHCCSWLPDTSTWVIMAIVLLALFLLYIFTKEAARSIF